MRSAPDTRSLGDLIESGVIDVTTGFPFGGHNENGSGVPHIRPFNVTTSGEINLEQIKSIPTEAAAGKPRLQRGDVVFNNTNTKELVGKCAVWDCDAQPVFSNHMTRIRVSDGEWDAAYLSFAILHHWMVGKSEMLARAHVAQASIMGERFREIDVPWHGAEDQRAVAAVLASVRECCRSDTRQAQNALELKAVASRALFARGLRGEPQKETEIGPVPASWDVVRLSSLGRIGNGSTPKKSVREYWDGGTFPWLTSAKVYDRDIVAADAHVTPVALKECHLPVLKPGAVLVAITGQGKTLGNCAVLGIEATINQHLAYLQPDLEQTNPRYVAGYLETQYEYLRQVGSGGGSTKGALTCAFLRDLPLPMPPTKQEQDEIADVIDAIDRKIDLHRRKRVVLEELFKSLLHKLMTGEIRVADLDLSALPAMPVVGEEAHA